jgi:Uma2 family endonuclease
MSLLQSDSASKGTDRADYPTSDGRPMGETDLHRDEMFNAIETLKLYFKGQRIYVTGNLLLFYKEGDRRRDVSPNVMVVKGVEHRQRQNYLLWEEGKAPSVVIEVTSKSTGAEDLHKKRDLDRDTIKVSEYFLLDPCAEYLSPPLQGFRLSGEGFLPIAAVEGRLPSQELGLHLEKIGVSLRFYDPATRGWLPTIQEAHERAEAELERLRRENESMRVRGTDGPRR